MLRGHVIGKWIRVLASVPFAPESILHKVHPLHQRITFEISRQKIVQFGECFLEFRMVVSGLNVFGFAMPRNTPNFYQRDALP